MALVNSKYIVDDAQKRGYAVPAINTNGGNYDIVRAVCEAAEELRSPIILMAYTPNTEYYGIEYFGMISRYFANKVSVPVAIHLDHSSSIEPILMAIRYGFTSVMIDYSKHELDENIAITRKVVDISHPLDISVEAEVGELLRSDGKGGYLECKNLASVEDVEKFTSSVPVDMLAVGIGNAHGFYKGKPNIRTDLLKKIRKATDVPLVLHGSTGIPEEVVKECIKIGIAKINFGTLIRTNYVKYLDETIDSFDHKGHPWRIQQHVKDLIKEDVKRIIRLSGSDRKF